MSKKQKIRPLVKVDPNAISLRSDGVSCATILFDDSNLENFNKAKFNLTNVAFQKGPKNHYDKLRRWAGRGTWMAVESHPEILDSDGVPRLDIVFLNRKTKRSSKSPQISAPVGHWFDPVQQFLDLPSGQLRVVYEDQFFCKGFDQNEDVYQVDSPDDRVPTFSEFAESQSYLIACEPGLYLANAFTRFIDPMEDDEIEGAADLAIYLTPTAKPASFRMSVPLLPVHPATQDIAELRRAARELPKKNPQVIPDPQLTRDGDVQTSVSKSLFGMTLEMPVAILKKFAFEPGLLLTLDVEGNSIRGVAVENATPDPSAWKLIERERKKPGSFVTFRQSKDKLMVDFIKTSPKQKLNIVEGEAVPALLRIQKDKTGQPLKIAMKQTAVGHKDAVQVPKKLGSPGPKVAKLFPKMEKCFAWTQFCVFELNGETMMAGINVSPPQFDTVGGKRKQILAAEIAATIAIYVDGVAQEQQSRKFRKFPEGINKAFAWVAKEMKGGWLWTNRFEVDLNFWNTKKSLKQKECEADAIAAWREVLAL